MFGDYNYNQDLILFIGFCLIIALLTYWMSIPKPASTSPSKPAPAPPTMSKPNIASNFSFDSDTSSFSPAQQLSSTGTIYTLVGSDATGNLIDSTVKTDKTNVEIAGGLTTKSLKVGSGGTATSLIQHGRIANSGQNTYTVTFPTPFATGTIPTISLTLEFSKTDYAFNYDLKSVTNTGFTYRLYYVTLSGAPASSYVAPDNHFINYIAYGVA